MPIYVYKCKFCDYETEVTKQVSEIDNKEFCLQCGALMARIPSLTTFHLKGGGWAKDGYCPSSGGKKGGG